uniref:Uncharacterized protein n=1 Tax=Fagus sylvatica TaxID=28930 RepID=A0A2N9IKS2_FAGSY
MPTPSGGMVVTSIDDINKFLPVTPTEVNGSGMHLVFLKLILGPTIIAMSVVFDQVKHEILLCLVWERR